GLQNFQNPSQPVVLPSNNPLGLQPKPQQNNPLQDTHDPYFVNKNRPQPPGTSERVWDENMGRYLQWLYGETPEYNPVPKPPLPPKPRPKSDKAKAYEEMIDYANLGINIEDNR